MICACLQALEATVEDILGRETRSRKPGGRRASLCQSEQVHVNAERFQSVKAGARQRRTLKHCSFDPYGHAVILAPPSGMRM